MACYACILAKIEYHLPEIYIQIPPDSHAIFRFTHVYDLRFMGMDGSCSIRAGPALATYAGRNG